MRQESHRIHWQQWGKDPQSKRDLITRSAAVRLTDAAQALNVVGVLTESLKLTKAGSLILVGTLHNAPAVQFEHELKTNNNDKNENDGGTGSVEPFHLVRTLKSNENPLQVRDTMQQVLDTKQQQSNQRSTWTIAPKLQWYFVPEDPTSQIPSCIELDGYATSMEDEDLADDEDGEENEGKYVEMTYQNPLDTPWRRKDGDVLDDAISKKQRKIEQQLRRQEQLVFHRAAIDHYLVSGYLWKQSRADPHVWRKMHCVLTEDHLWFVTRIKKRMPHYGRLALARALVVESSQSSALSRIPFSWEIISARGGSHVFRASSKSLQNRWLYYLKGRIAENEENTFLEQAELIVADESLARIKRLAQTVGNSHSSELTKWGLQVVTYREQCRHILHRIPTKTLVVASSASPTSPMASTQSTSSSSSLELPPLPPELQSMIRATWDLAAVLLVQATTKLLGEGRNAETLCRHIDYVLTGRMRPLLEAGTRLEDELVDKSRDPPPANLFDNLLVEFQKSPSSPT